MNKYFIVTIDTECDKDEEWRIRKPLSFKSVTEAIPQVFQPVFERHNVRPVYLISPEVLMNDACIEVLKSAKEKGAELGTHLHSEFIAPGENFDAEKTNISQSELTSSIEFAKLKNLTELFSEKFGFSPVSFRAGRFGLGSDTFANLLKLGYKTDSSVTPFLKWKAEGVDANYINSGFQPYKTEEGILEIPVTVLNRKLMNSSAFFRKLLSEYPKLIRILKRMKINYAENLMFRPFLPDMTTEKLKIIAGFYEKYFSGNNLVLVMMFHNVDIVPGCSPYCESTERQADYVKKLEEIFKYLQSRGFESITLSDAFGKLL